MNITIPNVSASNSNQTPLSVGIIGGGIAGSTIALRLAELGINVQLFEEGKSLVNGPPICHLHAGGNLYKEISDQQCISLLEQSIDTVRVYQHTVNLRPTVISIPKINNSDPIDLIPRLEMLKDVYQQLVNKDQRNKVIGEPTEYFKLYQRSDLERLRISDYPKQPTSLDEWMIPVAKSIDLDQFKFPLVIVQEYGLSVFRIAATADLALEQLPNCTVNTQCNVVNITALENDAGWKISYTDKNKVTHNFDVDYLVNAAGYQTGKIDDLTQCSRQRLVEFKAAYVTRWDQCKGQWPEVIFHGERGTPNGMAQLTPYPNGFFQLHGMTQDITLFKDGLVSSNEESAQPLLSESFQDKLKDKWPEQEVLRRTQGAIDHMARFIPSFQQASFGSKPLFGAQQIPGTDPTLRSAGASFPRHRYARSEIVKASSALLAADAIVKELIKQNLILNDDKFNNREHQFEITQSISKQQVCDYAEKIAVERGFPASLARPI